jgi:hypothetical protein
MNKLLLTTIVVAITAVITTAGLSSLIETQLKQERQLRQQITADLMVLNSELELIRQRLDQQERRIIVERIDDIYTVPLSSNVAAKLQNNEESLRALVSELMKEERAARRAATRESQWNRLRDWQENREGPYGIHNTRVNNMTRILDLDYSQASYYYSLIADYEERANALYEDASSQIADSGSDFDILADRFDDIEIEKRRLDETFDQAFLQTLTSEQTNRYMQLPAEERGIGPNAGLSRMQFKFSDLRAFATDLN